VAYASTDLSHPIASYQKQSHAAPAGCSAITLVHSLYRFTPHGGFECNYGGRDTRGWFRMITPLGKPSFVDATDHQELGAELRPCDDHCGERSHLASHT
jgi:hypothetical protein